MEKMSMEEEGSFSVIMCSCAPRWGESKGIRTEGTIESFPSEVLCLFLALLLTISASWPLSSNDLEKEV